MIKPKLYVRGVIVKNAIEVTGRQVHLVKVRYASTNNLLRVFCGGKLFLRL